MRKSRVKLTVEEKTNRHGERTVGAGGGQAVNRSRMYRYTVARPIPDPSASRA